MKVLFVVSIYNYHRECLPIVKNFLKNGCKVSVIIGWQGINSRKAFNVYKKLKCNVQYIESEFSYNAYQKTKKKLKEINLKSHIQPSIFRRLATIFLFFLFFLKLKKMIKNILELVNPNLIMMGPFHSCGMFDNVILKFAKKKEIATACFPVSAYHGKKSVIKSRYLNLRSKMLPKYLYRTYDPLNKIFSLLFPNWTNKVNNEIFFVFDPIRMFAAKFAGILEKDVWQKPSTDFDKIFVYNKFSSNLLDKLNYGEKKIEIVGIPLLDESIERFSDKKKTEDLFRYLGLIKKKQFIIFNVEPAYEHHYLEKKDHFNNFKSILKILKNSSFKVIISLHPLCEIDRYKFAEKKYGVKISLDYKIHDLYPFCKYVVSFPCSTNILSQFFNKTLVIYDFFNLTKPSSGRVNEFKIPNSRIVYNFKELENLILEEKKELIKPHSNSRLKIGSTCDKIYDVVRNLL